MTDDEIKMAWVAITGRPMYTKKEMEEIMDAYIAIKDVYHDLSATYRKKHGSPWPGADVDPLHEDELHFALRHLSCALSALGTMVKDGTATD